MGLTQLNFDRMTKVETAIERLREYEPKEGYFLSFSGGKDSICIYNLAVEAGVKFDAHYSVSPIDPPELRQFIKREYPDVIWDITAKGFWGIARNKRGLPHRKRRWCCQLIKEHKNKGRTTVLGIRTEESFQRRQNYPSILRQTGKRPPTFQLMPILDWNEAEVWEYIEGNSLAYPSLYDEGFSRIGCIMCPLGGKPQMRLHAKMWPKVEWLWWQVCQAHFGTEGGRNLFETPEEEWKWWIGTEPPQRHANKPLEATTTQVMADSG